MLEKQTPFHNDTNISNQPKLAILQQRLLSIAKKNTHEMKQNHANFS